MRYVPRVWLHMCSYIKLTQSGSWTYFIGSTLFTIEKFSILIQTPPCFTQSTAPTDHKLFETVLLGSKYTDAEDSSAIGFTDGRTCNTDQLALQTVMKILYWYAIMMLKSANIFQIGCW